MFSDARLFDPACDAGNPPRVLSSQEEVFLSQFSKGLSERRLAFIDRNKELWLCPVLPAQIKGASPAKYKLHTQVGDVQRQAGRGGIDR